MRMPRSHTESIPVKTANLLLSEQLIEYPLRHQQQIHCSQSINPLFSDQLIVRNFQMRFQQNKRQIEYDQMAQAGWPGMSEDEWGET